MFHRKMVCDDNRFNNAQMNGNEDGVNVCTMVIPIFFFFLWQLYTLASSALIFLRTKFSPLFFPRLRSLYGLKRGQA